MGRRAGQGDRRSKQRLSGALFQDERERLVRAMLRDVLGALRASSGLADVLVITRDAEVGALAKECGAQVLAERGDDDLNAALRQAAAHLVEAGAPGLLVVPADVPAVTPAELSALADEHGAGRGSPWWPTAAASAPTRWPRRRPISARSSSARTASSATCRRRARPGSSPR